MLKKALLELVKKGYEIYYVCSGDMITYNTEKSKFYYNEEEIASIDLEKKLDRNLDFFNVHIHKYNKMIEFE